jgi:hypothetical protein
MNQQDLQPHENAARLFQDRGLLTGWDEAAERGRRMAEENLRVNPEQRKLVESVYGIEYCRNRYPKAYHRR